MTKQFAAFLVFITAAPWFFAGVSAGEAPPENVTFEDIHVVALPQNMYGYRSLPGSMVELNDGRILMAYTRMHEQGRGDGSIAARYSADVGKTWIHERVIAGDSEDDYGYPSLLFVNDLALISYHWRDGLHVARIAVGWFYRLE